MITYNDLYWDEKEIYLHAVNNKYLYSNIKKVIKMLSKHIKRNNFNSEKAIKGFYNVVCLSMKYYCNNYCDNDFKWHQLLTVKQRKKVCEALYAKYINEIERQAKIIE